MKWHKGRDGKYYLIVKKPTGFFCVHPKRQPTEEEVEQGIYIR